MKRKTSTTPTRIYTYGCLPPTNGAEHLDQQMFRAHRYRNKLVEIERARRARVAKAQREHDVLGEILDSVHLTETSIAEARREIRLLRSGKADLAAIAAQREMVEALFADLAMLRFFLSRARMLAKGDESLKAAYAEIQEQTNVEIKTARSSDEAPYWGTYLIVEKAAETWRKAIDQPRFLRYEGTGRIAVQLQKGLSVSDLLAGQDKRLRIAPATPRVSKKTGRVQTAIHDEYRTIHIRVGSDGRAPIWAALPFVMHRPLPDDGRIMWAWIIRRKIGIRYKYELQLTVESESFAAEARSEKPREDRIAVDIGSRDLPTGETRVAMWLDSTSTSGEMKSPLTRLSSPTSSGAGRRRIVPDNLDKVEDLRSIRDKNLDTIKISIASYKTLANSSSTPELDWLRKRTERVTLWRSPARVALLFRHWQRHEGDVSIYEKIGAYLKQDRHLIDWQSHEHSRHIGRRRARYKTFAAEITSRYQTIVLAKRDYRRAEWAPEDAASTRGTESRKIMRGVAPGELAQEIKQAAKSRGTTVIEVPIEGDTAWALDVRVCERLLQLPHASDEMVTAQANPLAQAKPINHVNSIEPWRKRRLGTAERLDPLAGKDVTT